MVYKRGQKIGDNMTTKTFIRRPTLRKGVFCVVIAAGISPLSEELEVIPCGNSKEQAWQVYRRLKKTQGQML